MWRGREKVKWMETGKGKGQHQTLHPPTAQMAMAIALAPIVRRIPRPISKISIRARSLFDATPPPSREYIDPPPPSVPPLVPPRPFIPPSLLPLRLATYST
ncbi:hypothetical protein QCA50_008618 [Cerrena zonata]|uniref:Uncharacterized protein n=1 Tax=Cerrena zonata TaxID=2478898 RepID=A0AAW0GE01_9APHY